MSTEDRFREWDAAYVMGALAPAERREYEQHLSLCLECAAAVSALAGLSGPLAALSHEQAFALLEEPAPGMPTPLPGLLERAERQRRDERRKARWRTAVVAAAAAAVAAVIALAVPWDDLAGGDPAGPQDLVAMQQVGQDRVTAGTKVVGGSFGTRVEGVCRYADKPGSSGKRYDYALYVVDTYGKSTRLTTWSAGAGESFSFWANTSVPRDHVAKIEIRGVYQGKEVVLLTTTP